MIKNLKFHDTEFAVHINSRGDPILATINDQPVQGSLTRISEHEYLGHFEGRQNRLFVCKTKDGQILVQSQGKAYRFSPADEEFGSGDGGGNASGKLTAAMPGKVIKIFVDVGQTVEKDQPVLILESMKMEMTQIAPFNGKVAEVNAKPGQQVDAGSVIVRLEPEVKI